MAVWKDYFEWYFYLVLKNVNLQRLIKLGFWKYNFIEYFKGFEKVESVREMFGSETESILKNLKIEFIWFGYMGVDNNDGHILINRRYLENGSKEEIYLDIIHELCHVKQHLLGQNLFDSRYNYVDRPTEIEAYGYSVKEARKLYWTDKQICEYLKTEWVSFKDLKRLATKLGVNCP